jgi:tRNA U55 pseudouridine synthase TruB
MLELRRIRAGIIREHDKKYPSINLYEFLQAVDEYKKGNEELLKRMIIPAEIITQLHPIIKVKEREVKRLLTGKPIFKEDLTRKEKMETGKIICVFSEERFIGMYKVTNNGDIFAKSEFVMQPIK